jgi:hypothetical protein
LYANIESQVQDDAPHLNLYYHSSVHIKRPFVQGLTIRKRVVTSQIGLIDYLGMVGDGDVQKRKI